MAVTATSGWLHDQATKFPHLAHEAVSATLPPTMRAPLYACFADYATEFGANLNDIPTGAASLLRKYGTLEKMLAAGRYPDHAEDLRLYRTIATMDRKAPLPPFGRAPLK